MGFWKIGSVLKKPHKQFIIDRVAKSKPAGKLVKDVFWVFQIFRRQKAANKTNWSYSGTHIQKVRDALMRYPKPKGLAKKVLGYNNNSAADTKERIILNSKIQLNDLKSWVLSTGKQYLLGGMSDEIINFQNSYHN